MNIQEYIKPELLALAAVLYVLGMGCKRSGTIADKWIPYILGGAGILLACLYVFGVSDLSSASQVLTALFTGVTQGLLCAGASVYVNQMVRQTAKRE